MDLRQSLESCVKEAQEYGIQDPFADNNFRTLMLLKHFGLKDAPGRQGHDALDGGFSFELKTTVTGRVFSTSQQFTPVRLKAYRETSFWIFGLFEKGTLNPEAIYLAATASLEPFFKKQEKKLLKKIARGEKAVLNDPRINLSLVKEIAVEIKKPKPEHMTTMEFINMMLNDNDGISKGLIDLVNKEAEKKAQQRFETFSEKLKIDLCKVLQAEYVESLLNKARQDGASTVSQEPKSPPNAGVKAIATKTDSLSSNEDSVSADEIKIILETSLREFLDEKAIIVEDKRRFVSDNTFLKYYRDWFWKTKGYKPPKKQSPITQRVLEAFGLERDNDKGRILGIILIDMKVKSVLPREEDPSDSPSEK